VPEHHLRRPGVMDRAADWGCLRGCGGAGAPVLRWMPSGTFPHRVRPTPPSLSSSGASNERVSRDRFAPRFPCSHIPVGVPGRAGEAMSPGVARRTGAGLWRGRSRWPPSGPRCSTHSRGGPAAPSICAVDDLVRSQPFGECTIMATFDGFFPPTFLALRWMGEWHDRLVAAAGPSSRPPALAQATCACCR